MEELAKFPIAHLSGLIIAAGYFIGKLAIYRNNKPSITISDVQLLVERAEARIIRRVERMLAERR